MKLEEAMLTVQDQFPFQGYIDPAKGSYFSIARTVLKYLEPPAKILDFGSGPCDKTALLSVLGFDCSACDDLSDHWHGLSENREKIISFTADLNIKFHLVDSETVPPFRKDEFDMVMIHDVLEHLHDSPRDILNDLVEYIKPGGYLFVTVPNAANLMKRIRLIIGHTNLPAFESYYWYPNPWRGHIREYVKGDLMNLAKFLDLDCVELHGSHHSISSVPRFLRPAWLVLTGIINGGRDTWVLVAKKNDGWKSRKSLSQEELGEIMRKYTAFQY